MNLGKPWSVRLTEGLGLCVCKRVGRLGPTSYKEAGLRVLLFEQLPNFGLEVRFRLAAKVDGLQL